MDIKCTPKIYHAMPDSVRGQEPRIRGHMPALRLPDGRELAIITLSGNRSDEINSSEWASLIAQACNDREELIAALKYVDEHAWSSGRGSISADSLIARTVKAALAKAEGKQ